MKREEKILLKILKVISKDSNKFFVPTYNLYFYRDYFIFRDTKLDKTQKT